MLEKKLEEIKQAGNYSVQLWFGEGLGCDDQTVPRDERALVILANPVGCLGEIKTMWKGTLEKLKDFDFKVSPTKISNPPEESEYKEAGYYVWGTDRSVENFLDKFSEGGP